MSIPRLPRRIYLVNRWVTVEPVAQAELQDRFADDPEEVLWGGWDPETATIFVLESAPLAMKQKKFAHELVHAIIDLLDPE